MRFGILLYREVRKKWFPSERRGSNLWGTRHTTVQHPACARGSILASRAPISALKDNIRNHHQCISMSWKDVSPREKLVWMVQYYIVIVLTTASTFQSHTTSPSKKKNQTFWNAGEQVEIGFSFESDWLKEWCKFSGPVKERSKA